MRNKAIRVFAAVLAMAMLLSGCQKVKQIAGSVAKAAQEELESQVRETLEEYKLEMVEMKTVAGKLNDNGESVQIFCAVLVRTGNAELTGSCASVLEKLFTKAGVTLQTDSVVENPLLVHKSVTYRFSDFADGNTYYTIYAYSAIDPAALLSTGSTE